MMQLLKRFLYLFGSTFRWIAVALLLISGLGKLMDMGSGATQLMSIGIPSVIAWPIGTIWPGVELGLVAAFVCGFRSAKMTRVLVAVYGMFLMMSVYNHLILHKPTCSCFGAMQAWTDQVSLLRLAIYRSIIVEGGLILALCFPTRQVIANPIPHMATASGEPSINAA